MTGGYSLQNSSSAASETGDQVQSGDFIGGSLNFNNPNKKDFMTWAMLAGTGLIAIVLWKKL